MECYQKIIIDLLKASLYKKKIMLGKDSNVKWNKVINEAKQHKIISLIYSSIDRKSFEDIDSCIMDEWKREIFKDSLTQIKHINNTLELIENLKKQGFDILLLKGLVLRKFYTRPEYRTMCDADILVRQEDYLVIKNYLIKNGYKCYKENHPIHESFTRFNHLPIEIHWQLINNNYLNGHMSEFEKDVWKRAIELKVDGISYKTLCNEDFLIHMCLHLAVHIKYRGFGLRQLYDMAIFIKNTNIDWISFGSRISFYGISKFTKGIFQILNEIFDLNIPKNIIENHYINKKEIQLLLNNVLACGVHGGKEEIGGFSTADQYKGHETYVCTNVKKILMFIFPNGEDLSSRYEYAKNNALLLPIAWIHHAIRGIFVRKYGLIKMIKYYKVTVDIINRRKEIIKIFDL